MKNQSKHARKSIAEKKGFIQVIVLLAALSSICAFISALSDLASFGKLGFSLNITPPVQSPYPPTYTKTIVDIITPTPTAIRTITSTPKYVGGPFTTGTMTHLVKTTSFVTPKTPITTPTPTHTSTLSPAFGLITLSVSYTQIALLDNRIDVVENAILEDDPSRTIDLRTIHQDIDYLNSIYVAELENIHSEIERFYTLMLWLLGSILAIILGLIGFNWNSQRQSRHASTLDAEELTRIREEIRSLSLSIHTLENTNEQYRDTSRRLEELFQRVDQLSRKIDFPRPRRPN